MEIGGDAGERHDRHLDAQDRVVVGTGTRRDLRYVPNPGEDQECIGRPGHFVEGSGCLLGQARVKGPKNRHQGGKRQLAADPYGGAKDVEKDSDTVH